MQLVGEQYLSGDRWKDNLTGLVDIYRRRRDAMLDGLQRHFPPDARWTTPRGGFYVWVTLPEYFDSQAMLAAAVERRVAYVPGTAFYPDGTGRDRLRLAFCYPTESAIAEGVRRLGQLLADEERLFQSLVLGRPGRPAPPR
jgi:DNA-binding transcriptional MocR family regulator